MPKNKVTNYRRKSQRWKSSSEIAQVDDCKVGSEQDEDNKSDITSTPDEEDVGREDSGSFSGSADNELYGLNETCGSECSSVASGPSSRHYEASREPSPSQAMCSTCRKLYQRARRMKAPIMDKLLDKDPNSLSCDQWILIKKIKPKKQIATKRLVNLRLEQRECGEREFPTCSRPHIFLQRNLRCIKKPLRKRGKKRKRRIYNTQNSSVAKKQDFQMGNPDRNIGNVSANDCADSSFCSGFGLADCSGPSVGHEAALDQTTKTMPSTVSQESSGFTGKQKAGEKEPKTKTSFRDLLTQFLCNSSVIVRERR